MYIGCLHKYIRGVFRPETRLTAYTDLANTTRQETGSRSSASAFSLSWTVLELQRDAPPTRCCYICNASHPDRLPAAQLVDPRTSRYAGDFVVPLASPPTRPPSVLSTVSAVSDASVDFRPLSGEQVVPNDSLDRLRTLLVQWRDDLRVLERDYLFISGSVDFPDKQITTLVKHASHFLQKGELNARDIQKVIQWDSATCEEIEAVIAIISAWRVEAALVASPKSGRRKQKKARVMSSTGSPETAASAKLPAPDFAQAQTRSPRPTCRTAASVSSPSAHPCSTTPPSTASTHAAVLPATSPFPAPPAFKMPQVSLQQWTPQTPSHPLPSSSSSSGAFQSSISPWSTPHPLRHPIQMMRAPSQIPVADSSVQYNIPTHGAVRYYPTPIQSPFSFSPYHHHMTPTQPYCMPATMYSMAPTTVPGRLVPAHFGDPAAVSRQASGLSGNANQSGPPLGGELHGDMKW